LCRHGPSTKHGCKQNVDIEEKHLFCPKIGCQVI
jgi:hypothetical protein